MKGAREVDQAILRNLVMSKYLNVFSRGVSKPELMTTISNFESNRVFSCKTCDKSFSSFQALGGHRASHKKDNGQLKRDEIKSKTIHECKMCGIEFATGQALGGHMRKHKVGHVNESKSSSNSCISSLDDGLKKAAPAILKRSNSSKRVMCFNMDLNLTPLENDLKFIFGSSANKIHNFSS